MRLVADLAYTLDEAFRPLRNRHFVVLPRQGLAYGRVPKAANSSVKSALHQLEFPRRDVDQIGRKINRDQYWDRRPDARAYLATTRDVALSTQGLFVFAVVRSPFARLLSCYRDKVEGREVLHSALAYTGFRLDMTFRQFVLHACTVGDLFANNHLRSQFDMLSYRGRLVPEVVCRVEHLARDWRRLSLRLRRRHGVRMPRLPHRNRQQGSVPMRQVFDAEMVRAVLKRYAADFEAFYPGMDRPR